ncbi:MAG TPA: GTPase HflX [Syntrophales bacterium]|nr:GTPase HflX [Syntrophales bacterium]HOL60211.1 GTPase HflX [Syntrophales bacterium]HPO36349.1 GTPase HflX [Syntrophales bacterium]
MPLGRLASGEFARVICALSAETNRQIGVLIDRLGTITHVIVGDHERIVIPPLDGYRAAPSRLSGLRLLHTHLDNAGLSQEDLTDLALLRLDVVGALTLSPAGLPQAAYLAHLLPENPAGAYWEILPPLRPEEVERFDFGAFISALEDELKAKERPRPVEMGDRALLIRVETKDALTGKKSLEELKALAHSCGIEVYDTVMQLRPQLDVRCVVGKGKLTDIIMRALQVGANLLIFDHELTAAQVRTIGELTEMEVMDRTQVILEIFARRAHSREGKIQVELARMKYLLPRLVGRYRTLSRLTGGIGARGPGETKLEEMRRLVRDRISRLEKELKYVGEERRQRRRKRLKAELPVISIVGYTNAGKSTLLNTLTKSNVLAEDKPFATLDPKSARLRFPREREAIITDTVGFIRNLPADLLAAFRATLDELKEAHLLLHVVDIADPDYREHIRAVEEILDKLDCLKKPRLLVLNKADLFSAQGELRALCARFDAVAISALDEGTLGPLMAKIEERLKGCFP